MSGLSVPETAQHPSLGQDPRAEPQTGSTDWGMMGRQLWGVLRIELRYSLFSRRFLAVAFLALAPVGLLILWALTPVAKEIAGGGSTQAMSMAAWIYAGYLSTSVFLSALILFMSLFRGDILQRSLHYYFLSPVRRQILVLGKFLAAWIAGAVTFATSTALIYLLCFLPLGLSGLSRHLFQGPGLGHLMIYAGISVLAIGGYGCIFLLAGLFLRNPVVAGVLIFGWESINFFLPALLKKLSVIFYLQSFYPVPPPQELFAIVAEPISPWLTVPGLLLFMVALLALASWRAQRMEINYGED